MPKPAMYRQRQEDRFMGDKRYEFQNVSQQRSKNMSRIRGKDTSIEVALRKEGALEKGLSVSEELQGAARQPGYLSHEI